MKKIRKFIDDVKFEVNDAVDKFKSISPFNKKVLGLFGLGLIAVHFLHKGDENYSENGIPFDKPEEKKEIKAEAINTRENDEDTYPFDSSLEANMPDEIPAFEVEEGTLTPEEAIRVAKEEMELNKAIENSSHRKKGLNQSR